MTRLLLALLAISLGGCESTYYDAMERFGVHKREILIDRIEAAKTSQEKGQAQFRDALEQFQAIVNFDGGDLEGIYHKLNSEYQDSVDAADTIRDRISGVESVAGALFSEWQTELDEYSSATLKRNSQRQLKQTRKRFNQLMSSMQNAERTIDPVLYSLKDNVLYLKHNLNARAIASLKGELSTVNEDVNTLIEAMQTAINESSTFIDQMKTDR
tara:strand:- start:48 stop:689 length:642 start_codon:yes stop_codon:yes gene_type:complete